MIYRTDPPITSAELNELFSRAWDERPQRDFTLVLERSLVYVGAYREDVLVGFVNVAWDGGAHAFILDTTVHSDLRRQGIGRGLVRRATEVAGRRGVEWLHVDYEAHLEGFYEARGFRSTKAGLMKPGAATSS